MLDNNPEMKVIFFAEGQDILRRQAYEAFASYVNDSGYKISILNSSKDADKVISENPNVIVTLPQTVSKLHEKWQGLFTGGMVIVDEAHNRYLAKQVQDAIESFDFQYQLLLTGTPAPFVKANNDAEVDNYKLIVYSMADLMKIQPSDSKWFSNLEFFLSNVDVKKNINAAYTADDNLNSDYDFDELDINNGVINIMKALLQSQIKAFKLPVITNLAASKKAIGVLARTVSKVFAGNDSELRKIDILEFIRREGRRPAYYSENKTEKKLGDSLSNYINEGSSSYDLEFTNKINKLFKELGILNIQEKILKTKIDIIEFIKKESRKPARYSKDKTEHRLGSVLNSYTNKKYPTYDIEFTNKINKLYKELGILTQTEKKLNTQNDIIEFIKKESRKPLYTSKNKIEKRLGGNLNGYTSKANKHNNIDFINLLEKTLKEIKQRS